MKKLYRSRHDKKLFGLCGGIAEMLNVDATLLRILLIVLTVFTSGALIAVYILAGLVVPKEPTFYDGFGPGPGPGYGPGPGGYNNGGWHNPNGHNGYGSHYNGGSGQNYGQQTKYGGPYTNSPGPNPSSGNYQSGQSNSNLDAMMEDLEKKALKREIEELKAKLAKQEKGEF